MKEDPKMARRVGVKEEGGKNINGEMRGRKEPTEGKEGCASEAHIERRGEFTCIVGGCKGTE